MCRTIRQLRNPEWQATIAEVHGGALPYVAAIARTTNPPRADGQDIDRMLRANRYPATAG